MYKILIYILCCSILCNSLFAFEREIAITLDDFPFIYGDSSKIKEVHNKIISSLLKHKAPAICFVIADRLNQDQISEMKRFRNQGFAIGSHTYSHMNLRRTPVDLYIEDLDKADKILANSLTKPKYFRYPYLAEGRWWWTRNKVYKYLVTHNYIIAPVTIDSRDFEFNVRLNEIDLNNKEALNKFKQEYLDFVWQQTLRAEKKSGGIKGNQILLIHMNVLNSLFLDSLLQMFESHDYHFISLDEALKH